jgi:hypothetical protein
MIALASKQKTQRQRTFLAYKASVKKESLGPDPSLTPVEIPLVCKKT